MKDFLELARRRKSIRGYAQRSVPPEMLEKVLEAARLAPSAKNLQPYHIIVVQRPEQMERLHAVYPAPFFKEAPVVLAVCMEPAAAWTRDRHDGKHYAEVDATIAADHMTLEAEDLGLGTCWIAAFDPVKTREVLELPEGVEPLVLLTLGFPTDSGREKKRKSLEELVRYERW
jgi:nitroreductase